MLKPLGLLSPAAGVALVALVTAIIAVVVIKATSDQRKIVAARTRMYAAILEMRLFNDDLRALLRAQGELLKSNASYLRASLVPMLWLIVPFGLLVAQLDQYYGHTAVTPGQSVLVQALLRDDADPNQDPRATLASPPGDRIEIPGIWFPEAREVMWRLSPQSEGEFDLRLRVGAAELVKTLNVSDGVVRVSPSRLAPGFLNWLRSAESSLPRDSIVKAILVSYPERALTVWGRRLHWSVVYGVLTILFGLVLAKAFRVSI